MRIGTAAATLVAFALAAGAASATRAGEGYGPLKVLDSAMGKVLADAKGMTVYTFDKDQAGKSMCNGECAEYWPPVPAAADAQPTGDLTIITRDDGTRQWADDGKPLYTYVQDKKPGDTMGDKVKDVWHIVPEEAE
jgi:predicted lipoprotein with Yx(FWY)xxD motif